jgi:hypothetical protein
MILLSHHCICHRITPATAHSARSGFRNHQILNASAMQPNLDALEYAPMPAG